VNDPTLVVSQDGVAIRVRPGLVGVVMSLTVNTAGAWAPATREIVLTPAQACHLATSLVFATDPERRDHLLHTQTPPEGK
jgi:hypothetical protein